MVRSSGGMADRGRPWQTAMYIHIRAGARLGTTRHYSALLHCTIFSRRSIGSVAADGAGVKAAWSLPEQAGHRREAHPAVTPAEC